MSPISHSVLTSSTLSTAKKLKTPLKASVVILTTVILASCGSDSGSKSYYTTPSDVPTVPDANGDTGATGGDTGTTGGNNGAIDEDVYDAAIERAKKAEEEAKAAKDQAAAAEKSLQEAKEKIKRLEEQLAAGSGDTEALEKQLEAEKAKQNDLESQLAATEKQVEEALKAEQDALNALKAAEDAAKIKKAPEANKSGVQTLNVNVVPLSKVFKTTTRDFTADKNSVVARADIASQGEDGSAGLLDKLTITTSGEGDSDVANSNGFKLHKDNAVVEALGQKLPLDYESVYKDYGDDMRIGHIDGKAVFELVPGSPMELPVNGAAVIGNATKAENIPTEGTVGYTGDATHRKLGIGNAIEFGSSVFTADFVKKALSGKLSFARAGNIDLKASISGNKFSGSAADNNGYATEGGFFGGDAQYLGGIYEGKEAQGTYGASSDKQAAADKAVKDAKAAAEAAKKQAEQAAKDAASAQADLDKTKAEIERLEALIASGGAGDGELQAQLDAVKAELDKALGDKQAALDQLKAVQDKVAGLEAEVKGLKGDNSKLSSDLAKASSDLKAAQDGLTAKDSEIAKQKETLSNLQTKLDKANQDKTTAENDAEQALLGKKEAEEAAKQAQADAKTAKERAEAAESSLQEARAKIKALQEQIAAGGGDTSALEAQLAEEKKELERLEGKLAEIEGQVLAAQKAEADALEALKAAQEAVKIKNAPEATKSGVQSLNIDASVLGAFNTTTRDFKVSEDGNSIEARADIASQDKETGEPGLLPKVEITTSAEGDKALANGFKEHTNEAVIPVEGIGKLPLVYSSTYKDFGDDMRIGHIHGGAEVAILPGTTLPVDGVAVVGHATKAESMPTEGVVGYTGDATYREMGLDKAIEFGSSKFTADFVGKKLDGKLSFETADDIDLKANISGNKFSGSAADNKGYITEGGFYGGDAQYLGGVYEGNNAQGTYGAKSDVLTAAEQAVKDSQAAIDAAKAQAEQAATDTAKTQAELDATKAEVERLEALIANGGAGDDGELQAQLDAVKAKLNQALSQKQTAIDDLNAAKTDIINLEDKVAGLEGDNSSLKAELAEAKKGLQAQIDGLKSDNADLQAQADSLQAELDKLRPKAPENKEYKAAEGITGAQSSSISGWIDNGNGQRNGALQTDGQGSYENLTIKAQGLNTDYAREEFTIILKDNEKDKVYQYADGKKAEGFKVYISPQTVNILGSSLNNGGKATGKLSYTSVYNKFDNMQIGHVYGDIERKWIKDGELSTVYANGNATAPEDMAYMQELAKHNLQQGLQNGDGIDSGKVGYAGVSTYQENGNYTGPMVGTSEFDVDFVNQQLDGTLVFKGTDISNKKIKAEINGNKFSGNWNGLDTQGGFFGQDAAELGGIYKDAGGKGTYGAVKGAKLPGTTESDMTGFQSTSLSSVEQKVPGKELQNAIGYVEIRNDKSDFTDTVNKDGNVVPVDNGQGDNFTSFDKGVVRADMVKPDDVGNPLAVSLRQKGEDVVKGEVVVDAGLGVANPKFKYSAVYENFDEQMQVGHVYGNINSLVGDVSRAANVYVQGYATTKEAMADLASVNDGKAKYAGTATYIENLHLGDKGSFKPVNGTSAFDVDFVDNSVKGELAFAAGDYAYMPEGNKIGIEATINGNAFAGNVNGIDTAGGFYGDDAQFLGGIYQDGAIEGGKGTTPGTGTKFQGTFGAEKQAIEK